MPSVEIHIVCHISNVNISLVYFYDKTTIIFIYVQFFPSFLTSTNDYNLHNKIRKTLPGIVFVIDHIFNKYIAHPLSIFWLNPCTISKDNQLKKSFPDCSTIVITVQSENSFMIFI